MNKKYSIYIHIPFCVSKCNYCDFVSYSDQSGVQEAYFNALYKEIEYASSLYAETIDTIYIGGGTPSSVDPFYITQIMEHIDRWYRISSDCEISMEANPGTLSQAKCRQYADAGINRMSLGMQAAQEHLLRLLGRTHTFEDVKCAIEFISNADIHNYNIDLMFGIPSQTLFDWDESMRRALELAPKHVSAYGLIIEEGTPFAEMYSNFEFNDELERDMYHTAVDLLREHGYHRYEISNFALRGYECRHNINCWEMQDYIGLGLNAHTYHNGVRSANTADLQTYIHAINEKQSAVSEAHSLTTREKIGDFIMLALRTRYGVDRQKFYREFQFRIEERFDSEIKKMLSEGLIEVTKTHLYLSEKGFDYANIVMGAFL